MLTPFLASPHKLKASMELTIPTEEAELDVSVDLDLSALNSLNLPEFGQSEHNFIPSEEED